MPRATVSRGPTGRVNDTVNIPARAIGTIGRAETAHVTATVDIRGQGQ